VPQHQYLLLVLPCHLPVYLHQMQQVQWAQEEAAQGWL
jgi:hypothetical protein